MTIKAKQVAGVTTLVVVVVAILSTYHLATLARRSLEETSTRGELIARAIFLRASEVVKAGGADPYGALRTDGGVRSILVSSATYPNVTYATIVNPQNFAVAHNFRELEGTFVPEQQDLREVLKTGIVTQVNAIYSDRTFEIREPILAGDVPFGSIRIGVSTVLVQGQLRQAVRRAIGAILAVLLLSSLVAMGLAQWMLRPIHVIQSGLSRLGRGELDVTLDLPGQEFRDLGSSFEAVSAQLAAIRSKAGAATASDFESVMESLEDAVALFSPSGELIFSNATMRSLLNEGTADAVAVKSAEQLRHPAVRDIVQRTLAGRESQGPVSIQERPAAAAAGAEQEGGERMVMAHAIHDSNGRFLGAMLVVRNLAYLSHVHSTLAYSRKLAALGRLMTGVAHEVKNPLNAMTIHLELLKQKLAAVREPIAVPAGAGPARSVDLSKHVNIIADEIRRLDQVVIGFLKFARPEELKLQPVRLDTLISDVVTTATPEAERRNIAVKIECPAGLPPINADPAMMRQALLNLALNACQAMPDGGTLRIGCRAAARGRVQIDVEDTGVGIPPEHLGRIFDLYFTTKDKGSGIGLSMVYRIAQLHDGEVEVESTPGRGTRFSLLIPQA
jgi:signal transduction histidine kinase